MIKAIKRKFYSISGLKLLSFAYKYVDKMSMIYNSTWCIALHFDIVGEKERCRQNAWILCENV